MFNEKLVRMTFYITYVTLVTTGTICFIEALRTPDPMIRHILNLEVCISVVASYFYSQFLQKINNKEIDYADINLNRYTDWFISTPLMLLVLCLVLAYNNKQTLSLKMYTFILVLNFIMLVCGYMGETKQISRWNALVWGFVAFFFMYTLIYTRFVRTHPTFDNQLIFWLFLGLWSLYGVVYDMKEETKNIVFNILDMIAKAFVGIFFWMYLTKVVTL